MKPDTLITIAFTLAVVFYIFFDTVSTMAAYNYLGSFEYESSAVLKFAFDLGGLSGFMFVKGFTSACALCLAAILARTSERFRGACIGLLFGAAVVGIFVGVSNFNIVLNGTSITGLDSGIVFVVILVGGAILGHLFSPATPPTQTSTEKGSQ